MPTTGRDSNMAGYPPQYPQSGVDWKAQRRIMKTQARIQRQQMRMQARALRRGSIAGPIFLVAFGVIFLCVEMGRLNWWSLTQWFGRWWPLLLIAAGCIRLAEWAWDQHVQQERAAMGLPPTGSRVTSGGIIGLLIFVAVIGGAAHLSTRAADWNDDHFRFNLGDFDRALGESHDSDVSLTHTIAADAVLTIDNPRGDVTVTGTSDDGQMHIAVHKQVYAFKEEDADSRARDIQPRVTGEGSHLSVSVPDGVNGAHADLTIDVPRGVTVTVTTDRGDVNISSLHAPVTINANHGSVDLSGLTGSAVAHMHNDGATFSAHSVTGPVTVDGRSGDINVSDIHGNVLLQGDFFGTTHLERVDGPVHFKTSRTDFQMARLDGEMELDTGADLTASQVLGPVLLNTHARNISLERVQGNIQVSDRDGSVTLTNASPLGTIEIVNRNGSVDVGMPATASFTVQASTRHGSLENDFDLPKQGSDESPELNGSVNHGGPLVKITTTNGDVTVRKATVAPLPPVAPAPPAITAVPAPPPTPAPAATPKAPAAPKVPRIKPPTPPAPPAPARF